MSHIMEAPVLQISRFYTGLYTFRNPLIVPVKMMGRRIIELYDAIQSGVNMEITNTLTLKRRPGYVSYNTNLIPGIPLHFYSFKPSSFPGQVFPIVDTTTNVLYAPPGNAVPTSLIAKMNTAQTNYCGIGPYLYMGNPSFSQKWDGPGGPQGVTNWGIAISSQANATGPNGVGTGANSSTGTWTNPGNITANDGAFATNTVTGPNAASPGYLQGTNCGFSIPTTSTITGIQVDVKGQSSLGGSQYRPTVATGSYNSPNLAYDNNLSTASSGFDNSFLQNPKAEVWKTFPAGPLTPLSVTLNVNSQVALNGTIASYKLDYSLNNGATFTTIYTGGSSSRPTQTDSIPLPLGQDLTQVQVRAGIMWISGTGGTAVNSIYEIWIDAPTSTSTPAVTLNLNLLKAGNAVGSSRSATPTTTNAFMTFGGMSDLWGTTWSPVDVNATTFGAGLVASVASFTGAVNFSIDYMQITIYSSGGPVVSLVGGTLVAQTGYQYQMCYGNSFSGHVSSPTPPSNVVVPATNGVQISLVASTDPQVNQIRVFRTTDGGGQPYFELPTSPYPNTTANVVDNATDNTLQIKNICPLPHFNDPPPTGLVDPVWFSGRLWGHVGNVLYFSSGPDITLGNGPEAWFPVYQFALPTTIIRKFPLPNGMVIETVDDMFVVRGIDTFSFTVNEFMRDIGMRNWNAADSDGSNIYIYTTDRQMLLLNANGLQSISGAVSDIIANVDPSVAYVSTFRYTARNTLLFLGDGTTNLYPYNLSQQAWCPIQVPSVGVRAIGSIETQPGIYNFLTGKTSTNLTIGQRSISTFSDEGTTYACNAVFGPIPFADSLTLAQIRDIVVATATGQGQAIPSVGVLANEISGTFQALQVTSSEPPELSATPSQSFLNNRYSWMATTLPEYVNFMELQLSWPSLATADELYLWAIGGSQTTGGSALGPPGQLPQLQGR